MSGADAPQGPGWWVANDGRWYAPELHPDARPPTPAPSTARSASMPPAGENATGETPVGEGGFFARLFDLSMTRFITPSIIRALFLIGIAVISVVAVVMVAAGLATLDDGGIVLVLLAPVYWLLGIVYTRVLLEVIVVFFRIEANTRHQR